MAEARQHLILIPGSLCDERVWQHQVAGLSGLADIGVPALHGHASLTAMAEAIVRDAPARFALCGFAMGGRVALEVMRVAPERVTKLALIAASVHPVAPGEAERRQPQITMAHEQGMAALARWWNPKIAHPSRHDDSDFMGLLEAMACGFPPDDYEQEVGALLNRPDPRDLLGGIGVPALVLAGVDDPLSTPERNREIAAAIPGATLILLPGTAHFPMLEQPDAVNAALVDWLKA